MQSIRLFLDASRRTNFDHAYELGCSEFVGEVAPPKRSLLDGRNVIINNGMVPIKGMKNKRTRLPGSPASCILLDNNAKKGINTITKSASPSETPWISPR